MKRWAMQCLVWMVMVSGARAQPLPRFRQWSNGLGAEAVREQLSKMGVGDEADQARILEDWDEKEVVRTALAADAMSLLSRIAARDRLSDESVARILEHVRAKPMPAHATWTLYLSLPPQQQAGFAELLEKQIPERYSGRPLQAAMARKYVLGMGKSEISVDTETADLVSILLAEEPMTLYTATGLKRVIKDHAVRLAKHKIRADGESFVVRDGVNPLLERVRPVVEALNAPMAEGLEEALRNLGAEVEDRERGDLAALIEEWRRGTLLGESTTSRTESMLGRLAVGLGVEGFNAFVDEYNFGKKGGEGGNP